MGLWQFLLAWSRNITFLSPNDILWTLSPFPALFFPFIYPLFLLQPEFKLHDDSNFNLYLACCCIPGIYDCAWPSINISWIDKICEWKNSSFCPTDLNATFIIHYHILSFHGTKETNSVYSLLVLLLTYLLVLGIC